MKYRGKRRVVLTLPVSCDGATHQLGVQRNGEIVHLSHKAEDAGRWAAFAALGGATPACFHFKYIEDCISPNSIKAFLARDMTEPLTIAWAAGLFKVSAKLDSRIAKLYCELEERRRVKAAGEAKRLRNPVTEVKIGLRKQKVPKPQLQTYGEANAHLQPKHSWWKNKKRKGRSGRSGGRKTQTVYINQDVKPGEKRPRLNPRGKSRLRW